MWPLLDLSHVDHYFGIVSLTFIGHLTSLGYALYNVQDFPYLRTWVSFYILFLPSSFVMCVYLHLHLLIAYVSYVLVVHHLQRLFRHFNIGGVLHGGFSIFHMHSSPSGQHAPMTSSVEPSHQGSYAFSIASSSSTANQTL